MSAICAKLRSMNAQNQEVVPVVKLGLVGSIIFGLVLFGAGFLFKKYLGVGGLYEGREAIICNRAGWGMMILGCVIVFGNIAWTAFCVHMGKKQHAERMAGR